MERKLKVGDTIVCSSYKELYEYKCELEGLGYRLKINPGRELEVAAVPEEEADGRNE